MTEKLDMLTTFEKVEMLSAYKIDTHIHYVIPLKAEIKRGKHL